MDDALREVLIEYWRVSRDGSRRAVFYRIEEVAGSRWCGKFVFSRVFLVIRKGCRREGVLGGREKIIWVGVGRGWASQSSLTSAFKSPTSGPTFEGDARASLVHSADERRASSVSARMGVNSC